MKTSYVAKVEMAVWFRVCCKYVAVMDIEIQSIIVKHMPFTPISALGLL